ncbi:UNVERIFIED_CONTAM: hypothetical protein FKN15_053446 [Acipenser sinensis]
MPISSSRAPPKKNQALLVSVMEFHHGVPLAPRRGVKKDTKRLHKILSKLGFQVTIHNDLTAEEIRQACRGKELDGGVELQADSVSISEEDSFSPCFSIPIDSAVMFATAPGYSAFLHPLGSVFLQTLCDLLEEEGGRSLEVTQLMTRLNYRVAHNFEAKGRELGGKKEMPCFVTRLTRQVFPFADRLKEPLPL